MYWETRCLGHSGGFYVPERPCVKEHGKYIKEKINEYVNIENELVSRVRDVIYVACLWTCVLFYISFVCLHVCAYTLKFKVHCGSVFEPSASGFPSTPPVCIPNWRLCGDEITLKNGNLGDSEESNLIKLKVCDKGFRKKMWFPPRVSVFSMVLFLKSRAISFGRNLYPIYGSRYRDCDLSLDFVTQWRFMSTKTKKQKSSQDLPP